MHALEIERQADQAPFSCGRPQTAQRELAEAQDFLDDPDHGFYGAFAQTIDPFANLSLQFMGHLFFGTGFFARRLGQFGQEGAPVFVVRLTTGGDIGFYFSFLEGLDVGFTEITVVQGRLGFAQLWGNGIQGRHSFLFNLYTGKPQSESIQRSSPIQFTL